MNGCNKINILIDTLGSEIAKTVNTILALTSQGYLVNKCKYNRIDNANMLIHGFENEFILTSEQRKKLNLLANKYLAI